MTWPNLLHLNFYQIDPFFIKSLGELQELYGWLTALVLLFSSCHCFFLGFTDSLFSSLVVVVVVVEAGTGTGRVGKGGNTKNRVGEGEMVLIHTRSRREGGELCLFHWWGGVTSHLSSCLESRFPFFFLKTLIGLQGCSKGDLFLSTRAPREQEGIIDSQEATRTKSLEFFVFLLPTQSWLLRSSRGFQGAVAAILFPLTQVLIENAPRFW